MRRQVAVALVSLGASALIMPSCTPATSVADDRGSVRQEAGNELRAVGRPFGPTTRRQVPAGTAVEVRLEQDVDSGSASVGSSVAARVSRAVLLDGGTAIPAGARVSAEVDVVKPAQHFGSEAMVSVRFRRIDLTGSDVPLAGSLTASATAGTPTGDATAAGTRGTESEALLPAGSTTTVTTTGDATVLLVE